MAAWPFVVGDVAGLQLEGEVAGVAGVGQRLEAVGEVDLAVADGQVDVSRHGVTDVDMRDVIAEAADELDGVAAGGDDVAEVHHHPHPARRQAVGELLRPLEVPAQPVVVQRLGPQLDAVAVRGVGGEVKLGGDQVEVGTQRAARGVVEGAARQHEGA